MARSTFFDGERLRKAHSVRQVAPIFESLAAGLLEVSELRYINVFPERIAASNVLSQDGKKNPVVVIGAQGLVAVELVIDTEAQVVQFFAITSAVPGCGRKIVGAVGAATPEDWQLAVLFDWSGGFWRRMAQDYPRIGMA